MTDYIWQVLDLEMEDLLVFFNNYLTRLPMSGEIWGRIPRQIWILSEGCMPYDQNLAKRMRIVLEAHPGMVEKKMFGGVGFMLRGNLACGVQGDDLIVRVGVENNASSLARPFVRPFMPVPDKPMAGWILVAPGGVTTDQDLQQWIEQGFEYASTLSEK